MVVSSDRANATAARLGRGVGTVVAVTSNLSDVHPFQVAQRAEETGLGTDSRAQAQQGRSIWVERIGHALGLLPSGLMEWIDDAVRLHLQL